MRRIAAPFLLGLPDTGMVFAKQLYVKWKGIGSSEASSLQVGRFEFNDASELIPKNLTLATLKRGRISRRLIGTVGFLDVGRSFDGFRYSFSKPTNDFTFAAATPTRGVFQTDGWGWNRAAFGYASFTHQWGTGNHAADTRVFVIDYDDFRHIVKTDNRPVAVRRNDLSNIRLQTRGAHSVHALTSKAGTVDALGWLALQTGKWGTQTLLAYAVDFEGGFQPKVLPKQKPWLRGGFTRGSGEGMRRSSRFYRRRGRVRGFRSST